MIDPENRLVASELEARWNAALSRVHELEARIADDKGHQTPKVDPASLLALARALPAVWNSPAADMRLKQRIVRILVQEVVADVDEQRSEIVLVVHWHGGRHTEYRVRRNNRGHHGRSTSDHAIEIVSQMAGRWPDDNIAATLNRLRFKTGTGRSWNEKRVYALRKRLKLPDHNATLRTTLTLTEASSALGVSPKTVRRLIDQGHLRAIQAAPGAPIEIEKAALDSAAVRRIARQSGRLGRGVREAAAARRTLPLPGFDES
jgi:excisionase family DNA binding protein